MASSERIVTVFGGTGFVGHALIQQLAERGYTVRIPTRHPDKGLDLKISGLAGQVRLIQCNPRCEAALTESIKGASIVINLIGELAETKANSFQYTHVEMPAKLARIAKAEGVTSFVHLSALGANLTSPATYARTKAAGEGSVRAFFPDAIILRPGLLFGPRDSFFNRFALMARFMPFLPLIGGGHTKFQPLYVGDLVTAIFAVLARPDARGRLFLLGGNDVFTFRELMQLVLNVTGRSCWLLPVPWKLAKAKAWFFEKWPTPPLTRDQVEMLKTDNVVGSLPKGAGNLASLGLTPTPLGAILPTYLAS